MERFNTKKPSQVDLTRFGLAGDDVQSPVSSEDTGCESVSYRPASRNELFAGEEVSLLKDSCTM